MACSRAHLLSGGSHGTNPGEPILVQYQLDSWEQDSLKFESEFYHFHSRKCILKCHLSKWQPFCSWGDELKYVPNKEEYSVLTFLTGILPTFFRWCTADWRCPNRSLDEVSSKITITSFIETEAPILSLFSVTCRLKCSGAEYMHKTNIDCYVYILPWRIHTDMAHLVEILNLQNTWIENENL